MKRILLIDDNALFCRSLAETLVRAGYAVLTAPDGAIGLKLYQQQPADLVITDLIMPDKEGLETIVELRRHDPGVKIIAISGGGRLDQNDYLPMAKMLGALQTLAKPFTSKEILQAVADVLRPPAPQAVHE